tara:strand:- start:35 stop:499 length:465 start_codon:yes stop_codon:yes gene_type:complete
MSSSSASNDISINTFYNSIDTCNITWNILSDSMPDNWEFSICFPDCHNIGIISGQSVFMPNEKSYLNCHMYQNGQYGQGWVQMEIITNNIYRDTVRWVGEVSIVSDLESFEVNTNKRKLVCVTDIYGRKSNQKNNIVLLYHFSNGEVEKKLIKQ